VSQTIGYARVRKGEETAVNEGHRIVERKNDIPDLDFEQIAGSSEKSPKRREKDQ
jgi:hypothetical protein